LAPTAAPGGIAGTGITVLAQSQVAPPPPPETFGAYSKKSGENAGVIQMIDLLIADLDKEMTEGKAEEKDAQADYEQMMSDSAEKRAADSKSLSEQEAAKADAEAALQQQGADKKAAEKELGATLQYIHSLHNECDWLIKYFDVRKEARASEIDSLGNAKAVLSGADYSLMQTASHQTAVCGPQTKVCFAVSTNAVGEPQWACNAADDGAQKTLNHAANKFGAKICGPGKFHFSPMQCAGGRFEYKKVSHDVDTTQTTTGCQVVSFPYDMACYAVAC